MPHATPLVLSCPAKVNLALSVGPPQADGLHPIASWFIALNFGDTLTLTAAEATRYDLAFAEDAPRPQAVDWPLEKDLAVRAHRLLESHAGRALPLQLTLRKRVPTGAGLGGGSSDAAAVLVGVDRMYGLGLSAAELAELASQLGSDVPFFVAVQRGVASAVVTGTGGSVEAVPLAAAVHLTLLLPAVSCPTGPVYRQLDAMRPQAGPPDVARIRAMAGEAVAPEVPFNDLGAAALAVAPGLGQLQRDAAALLGRPVHVSGSGSTLYVVAWDAAEARDLATRARRWLEVPAVAVRSG